MGKIVFSNFAFSTLASPLAPSDVSMVLASGDGSLFPSPMGSDYFVIVLSDTATGENHEVVYCTARTGDVISITRAQEGTSAQSWLVGDRAECCNSAGTQQAFYQSDDIQNLLRNVIYPIGSYYLSGTSTTNPNVILGFGTWTAVDGYALVGYKSGDPDFGTLLARVGAKTVALTNAQVPVAVGTTGANNTVPYQHAGVVNQTAAAHSNIQPSEVSAIWRRTA